MSLMLEMDDKFPDDVKRYVEDYNKGVELQDIMEVNLAIDGLLVLIFSPDINIRQWSGIVLQKIANKQPGFLKKGIQVLLHRYKGNDAEKSEYASLVLGLLSETPAKDLISDPNMLQQIEAEHNERLSRKQIEEERTQEFLQKARQKELKFFGITDEFLRLGKFYNKLIIDEDHDAAMRVVQEIVDKIIKNYLDENQEEFDMGCRVFSVIMNPENREPYVEDVVKRILESYENSKKKRQEAFREFLIQIIDSIKDIVPAKIASEFVSISNKRIEEKKKESLEKIKTMQTLQKKAININVTWEKQLKQLSEQFNEALKSNDKKQLEKIIDTLKEFLFLDNKYIKTSAIEVYSQLLEKNYEMVKDLTIKMLKDYKKEAVSLVLEENIEILDKKGLLQKGLKTYLMQSKQEREKRENEEKEKLRKELERREKLKIEFSADWEKALLELIEQVNSYLVNEKIKDARKLILGNIKTYLYAEDKDLSKQTITYLNNVAKKYPEIIQEIMEEMIDLFKSEHERRYISVDLLGALVKNTNREILFKGVDQELIEKLQKDIEKRKEEIQREELETKWDAIKLDVTTIVVNLEYDKKLQKVCRAYNEAIKAKEKEKVLKNVEIIVDWFLNEKDEDRLNQVIEVLGKIAKQNIELIAPAIQMFLEMVESKDEDRKFRAIKGLGEVTVQRPGWAYMGISKLVELAKNDENESARMKALLELSRIGRANATMLMEHINAIIDALKDPNKHVRRLAAYTLGSMAEAIPLEAQDAIPALRDALHDDYFLVRQFADKALKLIRAAMRK